jgi:hypothetical protein
VALNSFTVGLQIADLPQFSGPRDLSNTFVLIRRHLNPQTVDAAPRAPISDAGIHRLVQLAYQTSLAEEEGRFPEFKLVNADLDPADSSLAATLDVRLDDLDSLRRLAPAVSGTHAGLLVVEDDGGLRCTGILVTGEMGRDIRIGRPEIVPLGKQPSLVVRVLGPASLRFDGGLVHAGPRARPDPPDCGLRARCTGVRALEGIRRASTRPHRCSSRRSGATVLRRR